MLNSRNCLVFFLLLFPSIIFSQFLSKEADLEELKQKLLKPVDSYNSNEPVSDYRIISSNNSYIEIEYNPKFFSREYIVYKNEQFSVVNFANAFSPGTGNEGKPDLKYRVFPIVFPSENNNSISITDIEFTEIGGVNLAPVPRHVLREPFMPDYLNTEHTFEKDSRAYSLSSYLPETPASIQNISPLRDILIGYLVINPYQYNPASKTLKQIKRIRIRINYGNPPVYINRKHSFNEYSLLKDLALNSDIALKWMNPKLLNKGFNTMRIENSALSTGDWYKMEIKDNGSGSSEGIYKLSKSYLENAGVNLNGINPKTIKMYGNGGRMLPYNMSAPRINDLEQIAIYVEGENDGRFDTADYILFYAKSINSWDYDTSDNMYTHYINFYSVSNNYWICFNTPQNGKRMDVIPSENVQNPIMNTSFREKIFYEPEINNLLGEGNLWLSERKSNGQSLVWNNTLAGLEENSNILYRLRAASRVICPYVAHMEIKEENSTMSAYNLNLPCVLGGWGNWISTAYIDFSINQASKTNGEQSSLRAAYYSNSPDAEGFIDWMEIQYDRKLNTVSNNFLKFDSRPVQGVTEYNLSPFSAGDVKIFETTLHNDVKLINPLEYSSGMVRFQKLEHSKLISKYIAVGGNGFKIPTSISAKIENQNLHGGLTEGSDFIIITPKDFMPAALRLKEKRESGGASNPDYTKTVIVDVQKIYNEFSGGILDPVAIRDFIKYSYDTWSLRPSVVLLFGDGDVDYKNILVNNGNRIPPVEFTDPNLNQVNNYTTDDFFVDVVPDNSEKPDLSIGRITVETPDEANAYTDKIESYNNQQVNGYWKNMIIYIADDGKTSGGNDKSMHTDQCERLAESHTPKVYDKNKLYLVAYPTVITSAGRRKPGVNKDILNFWNAGCIGLNFTGHGSPDVWTHEVVFEKDVAISQLNNNGKYPFVTVASCDFSKFDSPMSISGGELLVAAPRKGAIGTFAASRPVDGNLNEYLNNAFWDKLLSREDTLLLQCRLGDASFTAKNSVGYTINEKKFILIGDPSQRFQGPRFRSKVDSIAGLVDDTMHALSKVKIYGSIMNPDSSFWSGFNGNITFKLFDASREVVMHDEDGYEFIFKLPGGLIYSGNQFVRNGMWSVEFIVPKDISFLNKSGKIINYFYNNTADGHGMDTSFIIGGINPSAYVDTTGPDIKLYINNRDFRDGDVTIENFKLIADLFDESGINTTGTIGHKIDGILDVNNNNKYDLTPFYNSDSTYKSGSLEYSFTSISEGEHTIKVKAWDTYNNPSEKTLRFKVALNNAVKIMNVYNYPNPFKDRTAFTFQHNYPGLVNINIKIYTVAGRLINEIEKKDVQDKFVAIDWSGIDKDGEKLANGIYIYKLTVKSESGEAQIETGKLAVLK